jgi:hypothetical protein
VVLVVVQASLGGAAMLRERYAKRYVPLTVVIAKAAIVTLDCCNNPPSHLFHPTTHPPFPKSPYPFPSLSRYPQEAYTVSGDESDHLSDYYNER